MLMVFFAISILIFVMNNKYKYNYQIGSYDHIQIHRKYKQIKFNGNTMY
jgi:hypothetical protein